MKSYKMITVEGSPSDHIGIALDEFRTLADEIQNWADSLAGTNLESSKKYTQLTELAEELHFAKNFEEPHKYPMDGVGIAASISIPRRKNRQPSRSIRMSNAVARIEAVIGLYEEVELDDIVTQLQDLIPLGEVPAVYS